MNARAASRADTASLSGQGRRTSRPIELTRGKRDEKKNQDGRIKADPRGTETAGQPKTNSLKIPGPGLAGHNNATWIFTNVDSTFQNRTNSLAEPEFLQNRRTTTTPNRLILMRTRIIQSAIYKPESLRNISHLVVLPA